MLRAAIWSELALLAGSLLLLLSYTDTAWFYQLLIEFVIVGRIPGTEGYVQFEPFIAGVVCGFWLIWAYKVYSFTISRIHRILSAEDERIRSLEEIAL